MFEWLGSGYIPQKYGDDGQITSAYERYEWERDNSETIAEQRREAEIDERMYDE